MIVAIFKGVVMIHLIIRRENEEDMVRSMGFNTKFPTTAWHMARNAIVYHGHDPGAYKINSIRVFDHEKQEFNARPTAPKDVPLKNPSTIPLKIEIEVQKSNEVGRNWEKIGKNLFFS